MKKMCVLLCILMMVPMGCSGVRLDAAHSQSLAQRMTETCAGSSNVLVCAQTNAEFWQSILADSKKFMGGVTLDAVYRDKVMQTFAYVAAGCEQIDIGNLDEEQQDRFRSQMCTHLTEFQKAYLGIK